MSEPDRKEERDQIRCTRSNLPSSQRQHYG